MNVRFEEEIDGIDFRNRGRAGGYLFRVDLLVMVIKSS